MKNDEKPKNFDWVSARKACSASLVMESLLLAAKANVEAMAETRDGRVSNRVSFHSQDSHGFSVLREGWTRQGARFWLDRQQRIVVEFFGYPNRTESLTASLTLNDNGECRLLVDGMELQEWQFLKRALEPLFFSVEE